MASSATERVKELLARKRAAEEEAATARILGAAQQLKEKAEDRGVLAYLLKPVTRERPNERFLQNTLKSVGFANRRADESEMWERWDSKRERERGRQRQDGRGGPKIEGRIDEDSTGAPEGGKERIEEGGSNVDGDLQVLLSRKRPRGRGSVGSRSEEPGPYLPRVPGQTRVEEQEAKRPALGPSVPEWLRHHEEQADGKSSSSGGSGADSSGGEGMGGSPARDGSKKDKDRRKRRHKEETKEGKRRKAKETKKRRGKEKEAKEKGRRK